MDRLFLECSLRAALLVLATAAALYFMRVRSAAARHVVWTAVTLVVLALPICIMWGPSVSLPILPAQPGANASHATFGATIVRATALPSPGIPLWKLVLLGTYLLGFCLFAARLANGTIRARRLIHGAFTNDGIRTSPLCAVPVTLGFFRPVAIFPQNWRQWPRSQFDAVSAHEGEHVRRRDSLVQWIALLNRAVYWFHPAAWWLERTLRALAEEACDDAVLSHGHDPKQYAECLTDMARSVARSGFRVNTAGMAMPGEFLSQRVRKILQVDRAPSISRGRMACAAAISLMLCCAFTMAKLGPSRHGTANQRETPPSAAPGTKFVLGDLKIEGDVHDKDAVRNRILNAWKGRQFGSTSQLADTVIAFGLREDFQDRGYFKVNANITAVTPVGEVDGNQSERVTVAVNEGPQYRVGKVDVASLTNPSLRIPGSTAIRDMFPTKSGGVFDAGKLRTGLAELRQWYGSRGQTDVNLAPHFDVDDAHRIISVTVAVSLAPSNTTAVPAPATPRSQATLPAQFSKYPMAGMAGYTVPQCIDCPRPDYTIQATKHNAQGTVKLLAVIGANGRVTALSVIKGLPEGLTQRSMDVVKNWKLQPATGPDGKPAAVREVVEITFLF